MSKYKFPHTISLAFIILRSFRLLKQPIKVIGQNLRNFGGTYAAPMGKHKIIITEDPEFIDYVLRKNHKNYHKSHIVTDILAKYIGDGLLTTNGKHWLKQRKLIQPGFHIRKLKALYEIVESSINQNLSQFPTGKQVDIFPFMNRLAFETIMGSLFNISIPEAKMEELGAFISGVQGYIIKEVRQPYFLWWYKLQGTDKKYLRQAKEARESIRSIIHERKKSTEEHHDLLDMLLGIRYEDTGEAMDEEQLIDEILILIVAGHETTANALSWTLHLLAQHPEKLQQLREETANLSLESLIRHPYLNAVLKESLRLYPPAWLSDRVALSDDTFKEYHYPKGTIVATFFYGIHRSKKHWKSAHSFQPERFMPEHEQEIPSHAYHPFGAGPRSCIGNHFAMAEMAIFIKNFIHKFEFHATSQQPKTIALITLRPDKVELDVSRK